MANIQLLIEGKGSAEAAASLLTEVSAIPGQPEIAGTWKPLGDAGNERGADFGAIADICSVTAFGMTVAQVIFSWYQVRKPASSPEKKPEKCVEKAVLICGERRLLMKDASVEDIRRFLEKC